MTINAYHWTWTPRNSSHPATRARNARTAAIGTNRVKPSAAPLANATKSSDHRSSEAGLRKTATAVARPSVSGPATAMVVGRSDRLGTAAIHLIADVFI